MSLDQPAQEQPADSALGNTPDSEMSGQWIREQLKDAAESTESNPPNPTIVSEDAGQPAPASPQVADDSLRPLMDSLARNISEAVTKPIEDLERHRTAEREHLSQTVREQSERVDAVFAALRRLEEANEKLTETVNRQEGTVREQAAQEVSRIEALHADLGRERDSTSESIGALRGELEGFAGRLSNSERNIEEQQAAIARLDSFEQRRGEAMAEISRLVGSLQGALQALGRQEPPGAGGS